MTVPLDTRHDIRELDARGTPRAEIARRLGLSRNTVAKYADMEDMSPAAPVPAARAHPALAGLEGWIGSILEADLGAPRKRRHTAKRTCDRAVEERGCAGSYATVCRYVADWRASRPAPSDGCLELDWAPGTAQVDYGNFEAAVAGERRAPRLLVVTPPHSNARFCVACESQRSECLCDALRRIVEWIGRAPAVLVPDDATEAGRRVRGEVTESALFSAFRAHYRCASRYRDPYSGNEKGSVENAVGFLGRNLLVPVPEAPSLAAPNARLRAGCDRINASSAARSGSPTPEALAEDLAAMLALPGTAFDAVRWVKAKADKRGYVTVDGREYCAGPAWHSRELLAGVRASTVTILADRGRLVCEPPQAFGEGEPVRNPASLVPALVARPRAFGESTIRGDMPSGLVAAIDRMGAEDRRRTLRSISRAAEASGFGAACDAALMVVAGGRPADDASVDMAARRMASGAPATGGADPSVYDGLAGRGGRDAG